MNNVFSSYYVPIIVLETECTTVTKWDRFPPPPVKSREQGESLDTNQWTASSQGAIMNLDNFVAGTLAKL